MIIANEATTKGGSEYLKCCKRIRSDIELAVFNVGEEVEESGRIKDVAAQALVLDHQPE